MMSKKTLLVVCVVAACAFLAGLLINSPGQKEETGGQDDNGNEGLAPLPLPDDEGDSTPEILGSSTGNNTTLSDLFSNGSDIAPPAIPL